MAWRRGPAGVEEQGMHALGLPRNLGGPAISTENPVRSRGHRVTSLQVPRRQCLAGAGSEPTGARW
jgi:hypothetical protein